MQERSKKARNLSGHDIVEGEKRRRGLKVPPKSPFSGGGGGGHFLGGYQQTLWTIPLRVLNQQLLKMSGTKNSPLELIPSFFS